MVCFGRFVRLGNELERSRQGTGLGLYIARELCAANAAGIDYLDRETGADFRILWQVPQ